MSYLLCVTNDDHTPEQHYGTQVLRVRNLGAAPWVLWFKDPHEVALAVVSGGLTGAGESAF